MRQYMPAIRPMIQVLWKFVVKPTDTRCDGWTDAETELGIFDVVAAPRDVIISGRS